MRLGDRGTVRPPRAPSRTEFALLTLLSPRCRLRVVFALPAAQNRPPQSRGRSMSIETWTAERIEQLRNFVVSGLTCSQIAAEIGVTRNAVIGKIHRLGLSPARPAGAPARSCPPGVRHPRLPPRRRLLHLIGAAAPALADDATPEPAPTDTTHPPSLPTIPQAKSHRPTR